LSESDTIIPVRVINQSIALEQPQYANYLIQPKRMAKFTCLTNAQHDTKKLEKEFTLALRYRNWQTAYLKTIDGAQLHGRDSVEIEYTPGMRGGVNLVHLGNENLIFPIDCRSLEACEGVLIRKYVNAKKLQEFSRKFGFSMQQVGMITKEGQNEARVKGDNYKIYKFYFKSKGIVHLAWISEECDGWLKAPKPFFNGRYEEKTQIVQPELDLGLGMPSAPQSQTTHERVFETQFPVKQFIYKLNEQEEIVKQTGRAAEDDAVQEAQTNLWSAGVNGAVKASGSYASPKQPLAGAGGKPAMLDLELQTDRVYDTPMEFFRHPGPDSTLIPLAQNLQSNQQSMQGQVNFAATNRKDSRKTAEEVKNAERTQQNLNAVANVQFSTFLGDVYEYAWGIIKSLAKKGDIKFLYNEEAQSNDVQALSYDYAIMPAGEIDVIERDEKIQKIFSVWDMAQRWPTLQQAMLGEVIQTLFTDDADVFLQAMAQSDQDQQLKSGMREMLNVLLTSPPEDLPEAIQEMQPNIELLMQQLGGQA